MRAQSGTWTHREFDTVVQHRDQHRISLWSVLIFVVTLILPQHLVVLINDWVISFHQLHRWFSHAKKWMGRIGKAAPFWALVAEVSIALLSLLHFYATWNWTNAYPLNCIVNQAWNVLVIRQHILRLVWNPCRLWHWSNREASGGLERGHAFCHWR